MSSKPGQPPKELTPKVIRGQWRLARLVSGTTEVLVRPFGSIKVMGAERIPEGAVIFAAYHASVLDPMVVGVAIVNTGRLPRFLAKSGLYRGPVGTLLNGLGQIQVFRNSGHAVDSLAHAKVALAHEQCVAVYPDGTLTKDPEQWPARAKTGVARLAMETGAPVVPVAHWGVSQVWGRSRKFPVPRPTQAMRVQFGSPIDLTDFAGSTNYRAIADRITAAIARELAELREEPLPARFAQDLGEGT